MKIKAVILGISVACIAGSVMAQENDDMYFNSKDRAKLNASRAADKAQTIAYNEETSAESDEDYVNLTNSYSSRNVNPEYTSRSNSQLAQNGDENYFVNDYRFSTANSFNSFNNNYNNWYNRSWYNSGYYYGSMMNPWSSPYGGYYSSPSSYYYDYYNNPWSSPYYQSGWYGSLSYYGGSPYYGNSWGFGMGFGNGWNYPYYGGGYGSFYGGSYYGGYYGYNNYWGGNNVIVVTEGSGRGSVYGKRESRGGMAYHPNESSANRTRSQIVSRGGNPGNSGGRVATSSSTTNTGRGQDEYYNRSWRRSSAYQNSGSSPSRSSSWNNGANSNSWNNSNSRSSNWSTPTPSRSFEPSGGSRSSGGYSHTPSSGSGSGGRTRGRD